MFTLVHILRLLSIVIWVGGIIFFAFVLAPVAFYLLPSQHYAGVVVGGTLRVLDIVGMVCGLIFCAATSLLFRKSLAASRRRYESQIVIASIMILGTAYLHVGILPAMEVDRLAAGGNIEAAPAGTSAKVHFEKLHQRSERAEGAVLLCGLAIVFLMGRESLPPDAVKS